MKIPNQYYLILLVFLPACVPDKERRTDNFSIVKSPIEIKIENGTSNLTSGDTLYLSISLNDENFPYSEIELTLNGSLQGKYDSFPFSVNISTSMLNMGKNKIQVRASANDKTESKTASFTMFSDESPELYTYEVVHVYPHDDESYTQGLFYRNNFLYEGTGQTGLSKLRKVSLEDGKVVQEQKLNKSIFGEGIALHNDKIYQLSWKNQIGFVYDLKNFKEIGRFYYQGEGWGLTADDKYLYRSDGSNKIFLHNPVDFSQISIIEVYSDEFPVTNLNELEYIDGKIYANIWQKDEIAIINPENGKLEGLISLKGLLNKKFRTNTTDVLNGIAFDSENNRIFVTGKNWPKLFEIKPVPKTPS